MDLSLKTETFGGDNQSWLDSAHGQDAATSITIVSGAAGGFTPATHYATGTLPSGTPLGKINASGKYGLYNGAASDGRETLVGFLLTAQKIGTSDIVAPLLRHGRVNRAALPFAIDTDGATDVAGRIDFI